MTAKQDCTVAQTWVAIDIAKKWNVLAVESTDGQRRSFKLANTKEDYD